MDKSESKAAPREGLLPLQILFFLRFIQLGSTVVTGFIACFLVWWHNRLHDKVPLGLIIVISTCTLAFVESYISSANILSKRGNCLHYGLLRKTTVPSALAMAFGYWSLRQVPFVRTWCEGDNWFRPVAYGGIIGVEEHHCALICDIIVAGAIAMAFTVFLAIFAAVGMIRENWGNSVKLHDGPCDYSDELLSGHAGAEKDLATFDSA